jgi:putative FmdB family regulatory protein
MPTYDYKCDACGHTFELFQSIKADPMKRCPACGKNKVKRLIGTGAGLIFKGSGFYITDYRDKSYADKAKAESGAPADAKPADGSGGDKAEAKPAATAEKAEAKPADKPEPTKAASKSASKTRGKKKD